MKKLKIEELHVDSFTTSSGTVRRGTVVAHQTYDAACGYSNYTACLSCGSGCTATAAANCTDDTTDTRSEVTICGGTDEGSNCCNPYDISLDWTFCDDTMCC